MNIIIRKAKPEEAEKIIDINIKVWKTTYKGLIPQEIIDKVQSKDEARIEKSKINIREKQNTIVAEVDGEIVGYQTFGQAHDKQFCNSGEIYASYILDDFQMLGLGRRMAQSAFEPLGIYVGKDNVYYHEDLEKSLNYNLKKSQRRK